MVTASDRDGVALALFTGNYGYAPEGRSLLQQFGPTDHVEWRRGTGEASGTIPVCLLVV